MSPDGGVVLVAGKQRFEVPGPLPEDRIVNIPRGSGIRDIAEVLMRQGVIDQPWIFVGGVLVLKAREDLKAGEYQFKVRASLREVVAIIVEGRVVSHQLTIPEGLTSEEIVACLRAEDWICGMQDDFCDAPGFGKGPDPVQRAVPIRRRLSRCGGSRA